MKTLEELAYDALRFYGVDAETARQASQNFVHSRSPWLQSAAYGSMGYIAGGGVAIAAAALAPAIVGAGVVIEAGIVGAMIGGIYGAHHSFIVTPTCGEAQACAEYWANRQ